MTPRWLSDAPLSKSRYVAGLQCPLRLYLSVHHRELATPPSPEAQARFEVGHRIGALAQARYPGGVLVSEGPAEHAAAVATTERLLADGVRDIFEAAFTYDRVKVRVDILHRLEGGGFELVEVKSTTRFDAEKHLPDVGIQLYVLRGAGLDVRRVTLMHINRTYVYPGGAYDPHAILTTTDVTGLAAGYAERIASRVSAMLDVLAADTPPVIAPSPHCTKPYECEFLAYCTHDVEQPDHTGVEPVFDPSALRSLRDLHFPLLFVDFETVNPALPLFCGTSPYQTIPVQWSLHRLDADSTLSHDEWLVGRTDEDPSAAFLASLLDALGTHGTFIHYSPYELVRLRDLGLRLPALRDRLLATIPGLYDGIACALLERGEDPPAPPEAPGGLATFDLGKEAVKRGVSHPSLGEQWTIKKVAPLLAPEVGSYDELAIANGDAAMLATMELLDPETPPDRAEELRRELLRYCALDTLAMVGIYRTLVERS